MSFIWQPADPIQMSLISQRPKVFVWQGRQHQVRHIAKEWRIDWGWWRLRLWRDYYKVLTDGGLLILLYQDLLTEDWYLQQIYD